MGQYGGQWDFKENMRIPMGACGKLSHGNGVKMGISPTILELAEPKPLRRPGPVSPVRDLLPWRGSERTKAHLEGSRVFSFLIESKTDPNSLILRASDRKTGFHFIRKHSRSLILRTSYRKTGCHFIRKHSRSLILRASYRKTGFHFIRKHSRGYLGRRRPASE